MDAACRGAHELFHERTSAAAAKFGWQVFAKLCSRCVCGCDTSTTGEKIMLVSVGKQKAVAGISLGVVLLFVANRMIRCPSSSSFDVETLKDNVEVSARHEKLMRKAPTKPTGDHARSLGLKICCSECDLFNCSGRR